MSEQPRKITDDEAEVLDGIAGEQPEYYDREMLAADLAKRQAGEEEVARKAAQERDEEAIRHAWKEANGTEPSAAELRQALVERRKQDAVEVARQREAGARRGVRSLF